MTVVYFVIFLVLFVLKWKLRATKQGVKRGKGEKEGFILTSVANTQHEKTCITVIPGFAGARLREQHRANGRTRENIVTVALEKEYLQKNTIMPT